MTVSKDNSDRIIVAFRYNPDYVTKVKTIPGHRWHPAHVSTKSLGKIKSPLDSLSLREGGDE